MIGLWLVNTEPRIAPRRELLQRHKMRGASANRVNATSFSARSGNLRVQQTRQIARMGQVAHSLSPVDPSPSTCVSKHRRPSNAISARCRPVHYFLLPGQRDTTYGGASNNSSSHFFSHAVNSGIGAKSTQILFLTKIAPPCRFSGT